MVGFRDNEDKYLTLLAQRAMYEEVEKIIKEEGYGGKIVYLTTLDARTEDTLNNCLKLDTELADMSVKRSNKEIIDIVFKGTYDTSLNLILDGI